MKNGPAYSHDEKIAIIRKHTEKHRTLKEICEGYGISRSYLCCLLKQYRENGKNGIRSTRYYSEAFKLCVVKRHYEDGTTIMELVQKKEIKSRIVHPLMNASTKNGRKLFKRQRNWWMSISIFITLKEFS